MPTLTYKTAKNPEYTKSGDIRLVVDFDGLGELPFTASPVDPMDHGREIYERAKAGDFGKIKEYVEPTPPPETQESKNRKARAYLTSTDWVVTRFIETGVAIPEEIATARQQARESIIE